MKIVVLGSMSKTPVAGSVWQTAAYLVGLERLGFETYYVEAHARTPTTLMAHADDDSSALAAGFIDSVMRRFGLGDRWALHALHADGRVYGISEAQLSALYRDAACILNLHGGTLPRPEHTATGRLVYLETDPVEFEVQLHQGDPAANEYLDAHCAFFTLGCNYGAPDCGVPLPAGVTFKKTLPPVLLDQWTVPAFGTRDVFTTVGNWKQEFREVELDGEVYRWSKHHEFLKFLELPRHTEQAFELALASDTDEDRLLLRDHGWRVRDAFRLSGDIDGYRRYIAESRGEFTVAKDQNVRLRSGWFSDRSATYLAAGCPVITQDTAFGATLPTGEGLFAFSTLEQIVEAVDRINRDHDAAARAARELAREYFDAERVLGEMVDELGLARPSGAAAVAPPEPPADLELSPVSRWPTVLAPRTVERTMAARLPPARRRDLASARPDASVVVVTCENLVFTRLCLESVLAAGDLTSFELIVIDNGSADGTQDYLEALSLADPRVRVELGAGNLGFAGAVNRGLAAARGDAIVLLNNDTIVAPGWLSDLVRHLRDGTVGLISAVSNRAATEAQLETDYDSYGGFRAFAAERRRSFAGERRSIPSLTLFCAAVRRDVYGLVGPLDEQFGLGMFEDDDYVQRVRAAGYEIACAEDVFVHHFGQASIGWLARTGAYGALFAENRRRFDEKWATTWRPHSPRYSPAREQMIKRAGALVDELVAPAATVLVVSKGDEQLLELAGRSAWHFPQDEHGAYAGFHPRDADAAIGELDALRARGATHFLIPQPSLWWLDHYADFGRHLAQTATLLRRDEDTGALYALNTTNQLNRRAA